MSTFEGTLKERDKTHTTEMELERKKREELEALVVTMQHNYQQKNVEIGSETVNRPSAQPDELITGAGVGLGGAERAKNFQVGSKTTKMHDTTKDFQPGDSEDTEMQDNSSMVDSKWQVRSGKGQNISDNSDDAEFFIGDNGEMYPEVSGL